MYDTVDNVGEVCEREGIDAHFAKGGEREIARAIEIANREKNVDLVMVGNEALYRGDVSVDELIGYIDRVNAAVGVSVSTAEPWHIWLKYPELADHVKLIAAHMLPYWEKERSDRAVASVLADAKLLKTTFPKKRLLLAHLYGVDLDPQAVEVSKLSLLLQVLEAGRLAPSGLSLLVAGLDPVARRKANLELDDFIPDRIGALVVGYRK